MTEKHTVVEKAARGFCTSGKFETGQGTCAAICLSSLGNARIYCPYVLAVHGERARAAISAMVKA